MSRSISYNGKTVAFRPMPDGAKFVEARRRIGHIDACPLCKAKFRKNEITSVVLIISNQVGIPNRFVHQECLEDKTDEYAFGIIAASWEDAQAFRDWFSEP